MTWHFDLGSYLIGFLFTCIWAIGVLLVLRVWGILPRRSFKQVAGNNSVQVQAGTVHTRTPAEDQDE